jgi:adenylosuccinate synthase
MFSRDTGLLFLLLFCESWTTILTQTVPQVVKYTHRGEPIYFTLEGWEKHVQTGPIDSHQMIDQ